MTYNNLLTF